MRKLLLSICLLFSLTLYSQSLKGQYISEDINTNECTVSYTFIKDSLYIDTYPSGCGITSMSLENISYTKYRVTETIDNKTKIYYLSFLPCDWDDNSYAVCKKGKMSDVLIDKEEDLMRNPKIVNYLLSID